jgi:hypothetical protein
LDFRLECRFSLIHHQPTFDLFSLEMEALFLDFASYCAFKSRMHLCFIVHKRYFGFRRKNVRRFISFFWIFSHFRPHQDTTWRKRRLGTFNLLPHTRPNGTLDDRHYAGLHHVSDEIKTIYFLPDLECDLVDFIFEHAADHCVVFLSISAHRREQHYNNLG